MPKPARQVADKGLAARIVERARSRNEPALAFSRAIDPDTGEHDEAELIAAFDVPPEFMGEHADV